MTDQPPVPSGGGPGQGPTTGRDRVAAEYGQRVVQALDDFLDHADEAAWALGERHRVDPRVARMMAESLVVRLGEAVVHVGRPFADAHPGLNLRGVAAARNVAVHGYDIIDHEILWTSFEHDLPPTVAALRLLLTSPSAEEDLGKDSTDRRRS